MSKFGVPILNNVESVSDIKTEILVCDDLVSNVNVSDKCGVGFMKSTKFEYNTNASESSTSVTQSDSCTCMCRKIRKVNKITEHDKGGTMFNENKQICFNYGTPATLVDIISIGHLCIFQHRGKKTSPKEGI